MDPTMVLARTILGIIGNVISFGLFLSPMPTITRYYEKKSTEEFHPYNYLAGIMNCMLWVLYGLPFIHPNSTLIWTINGIGLIMYSFYISVFFWYTTGKFRRVIVSVIIGEIIVILAIALPTYYLVEEIKTRSTIVGTICIVFNIILYGSPLTVLVKVFKTKSVEFLPFWVSLAGFANGSVWTAYGLLPVDVNLLVGNGTGAVLSLFQLILHVIWGHPIENFLAPFIFVINYRSGKKASKGEKAVELENIEVAK